MRRAGDRISSSQIRGRSEPRMMSIISKLGTPDPGLLVDFLAQKIAPLKLEISQTTMRRVNVLIATVSLQYFFAGSMCMFNLALRLGRSGHRMRILITDPSDFDLRRWKKEIAQYPALRTFFDEVEIAYLADRTNAVSVSPEDEFIATSWWTAHVAHRAVAALGRGKFTYLIQEYEPMFHPAGSLSALAEQALTFPHNAIFSTEILRDYFAQNQIGVFAAVNGDRAPRSIVIRNAVNAFAVDADDMRSRKHRRLFFYARPEQANNARNIFELGVLTLREVLQEQHFDLSQWEFDGIGAMSQYQDVPLAGKTKLRMKPGMSLPEFIKLLPTYDLGLSLMLTPHPSMMPLDMAAAGLVTVTNTYATKTRERMAAISSNIIAAQPTLEELKTALISALAQVDDVDKRLAGSKLNWPTTWDETFSPEVMDRLNEWLDPQLAHS